MSIAEQIKTDVTAAMKARDSNRVGALRLVLSELQKDAKEGKGDEEAVLRRERKRRRDAESQFRDAGRDELATKEAWEADLIESYLPAEISDADLEALVRDAIASTGAESARDMGRVMKAVMASGRAADGSRVSAKVKELLVS